MNSQSKLLALSALVILLSQISMPLSRAQQIAPVQDPVGDSSPIHADIVGVDAVSANGNLTFTITVGGSPSDLSAGYPSLAIPIDTDQNATTYVLPWSHCGVGPEFFIFSQPDRSFSVTVNPYENGHEVYFGSVVQEGDTFRMVVPLVVLNNDDGIVNFTVQMQSYPDYRSDFAPDDPQRCGFISSRSAVSGLLQSLAESVFALNLRAGIQNSLDAKLDTSLRALTNANARDSVAAINSLQAFMNAVEAQRGKQITESDADALVSAAHGIISTFVLP